MEKKALRAVAERIQPGDSGKGGRAEREGLGQGPWACCSYRSEGAAAALKSTLATQAAALNDAAQPQWCEGLPFFGCA